MFVVAVAVREQSRQERHSDSTKHGRPDLTAGPAGGMEKGPVMSADVLLAQGTFSCSLCEVFPDLKGAGQAGGGPGRRERMEGESGFSGVAHRSARFRAQGNKIKAVVRLKYIRRALYRNRGFVVDRILFFA